MRSSIPLLLFITIAMMSCNKMNETVVETQMFDGEVESIILNAKFDYRTKFQSFLSVHSFLDTPLWESYSLSRKNDSVLVITIPIKTNNETLKYSHRLDIVKKNNDINYFLNMCPSNAVEYEAKINNEVLLCQLSTMEMTVYKGSIKNEKFQYESETRIAYPFLPSVSRAGLCDNIQCHIDGTSGWDIDGGELPGVTITPGQGAGDLDASWYEDWFWSISPIYPGGGGTSKKPDIISNPKNMASSRIPYSASQYPGYGNGLNCKGVADRIMKQILGENANIGSPNNAMQLWKENNGKMELVGNPEEVVCEIDRHIEAGRPIVVGVNHTINSGINNADGTTDHFLVIVGKGYSEPHGLAYFDYIETGRSVENAIGATSPDLRLYYEPETGRIYGEKYDRRKIYDVVQIRPNM